MERPELSPHERAVALMAFQRLGWRPDPVWLSSYLEAFAPLLTRCCTVDLVDALSAAHQLGAKQHGAVARGVLAATPPRAWAAATDDLAGERLASMGVQSLARLLHRQGVKGPVMPQGRVLQGVPATVPPRWMTWRWSSWPGRQVALLICNAVSA